MSADNWALCPRCRVKTCKERERRLTKAEAAYGKKPPDEYLALRTEAEAPLKLEQTLREDYQIGVNLNGRFGVYYRARCTACDFKFEHDFDKEAEQVPEEFAEDANVDDPYGYNYRPPVRLQ